MPCSAYCAKTRKETYPFGKDLGGRQGRHCVWLEKSFNIGPDQNNKRPVYASGLTPSRPLDAEERGVLWLADTVRPASSRLVRSGSSPTLTEARAAIDMRPSIASALSYVV